MEIVKKPSVRFSKTIICPNCQFTLKVNKKDLVLEKSRIAGLFTNPTLENQYDCFVRCMKCDYEIEMHISQAVRYWVYERLENENTEKA